MNVREMCHCHGACFLAAGGKFRGYGKQLRESLSNMRVMCQRHGAFFLDSGEKNSWYGRQLREYVVNMREKTYVMLPVLWMWVGHFVGTGDN